MDFIVYGAGHKGSILSGTIQDDIATFITGNLVRRRNTESKDPVEPIDLYESFSISEFTSVNGNTYYLATQDDGRASLKDEDIELIIKIKKPVPAF
jgi:hypothetical protein